MPIGGICRLASSLAMAAAASAALAAEVRTAAWNALTEKDYGETISVCGPVSYAMGPGEAHKVNLGVTLGSLVIGGEPTTDMAKIMNDHSRFKVVIQNYTADFPPDPVAHYVGKEVCVVGRIVSALVGGFEVLPTHPSQIAIKGQGEPKLPRGDVKKLPPGAISFEDAKAHIGQTRTVCGVVVSGWGDMIPAKQFPPGYDLPPSVRQRLGPDFKLPTDTRKSHELYVGERTMMTVALLDSGVHGLPKPPVDHYQDKDICVTGRLQPSIMEGVHMVIDDVDKIAVLD